MEPNLRKEREDVFQKQTYRLHLWVYSLPRNGAYHLGPRERKQK